MSKKCKTKFYGAANRLLNTHAPVDTVYELQEDYNITKEEITEWITAKTRNTAIKSALQPISREEQSAKYNIFDQKFIERFPNTVTYRLGTNVTYYNYESGVYKLINDTDMEDLVDGFMFQLGLLEYRNNRKSIKDTISRIGSLLSRTKGRHFKDTEVSKDDYRLNLKNGLLNMKTHKLKDHTPDYFSTFQVPYDYDPDAKCPKFDDYLETVAQSDPTTVDMLQEMFGYCIGEGNPQHKVFYLYGDTARNGKSTAAKIICNLIGSDHFSTLSLKQIAGENSSALVQLIGKQLNFSDEISSKYIESSMLTTLSAEGIIEINPKYKNPFMYQVKSKFIITCNSLPKFQNGQGMKHRMISIPFQYHIPIRDRIARFDEVLVDEEGSGILNWAIEGSVLLAKRGEFSINEKAKEDMHQNTKESNTVYALMYDVYDFDPDDESIVEKMDIYDVYTDYCGKTRLKAKGYTTFCTELRRFANETKLIKEVRKNNHRYYIGLKKRNDEHF